ncbi:uncharacterized protein METZ01_LOCUS331839 [marine metagenome]|uniref:Uncharacterized protein n=1 Tax=marine metagenome TaxID=408172 RepID=A0A382Q208_9ZZZZ
MVFIRTDERINSKILNVCSKNRVMELEK